MINYQKIQSSTAEDLEDCLETCHAILMDLAMMISTWRLSDDELNEIDAITLMTGELALAVIAELRNREGQN